MGLFEQLDGQGIDPVWRSEQAALRLPREESFRASGVCFFHVSPSSLKWRRLKKSGPQ